MKGEGWENVVYCQDKQSKQTNYLVQTSVSWWSLTSKTVQSHHKYFHILATCTLHAHRGNV